MFHSIGATAAHGGERRSHFRCFTHVPQTEGGPPLPSSPCLLTHTRHRGATRPPRGDRDWLSEPDPVEPGGLTFGPIGPGPVSAPLMPVFPSVGIDVPQEGAGFTEDFSVCAWVVFLDLKEGQKQGPEQEAGLPGAGLQVVQREAN